MSIFVGEEGLHFGLKLDSPFNFICQRCGSCCFHRRIGLNEYEVKQLGLFLSLKQEELISRYVTSNKQPELKTREDGSCVFLIERQCRIHHVRPLVCRLYPLGLLFTPDNEVKWGLMPLHPDCVGLITVEGTVEAYLESQAAISYLDFELSQRRKSPHLF
ncbi:MAG: YkgJ family cysteine cluster protein [Candidatus Aminicenantales bacterium]